MTAEITGSFEVPAGRLLGRWFLRASVGGQTEVRVEEYKRPTFEVTVDDPSSPMRLNRPATLTGEARYYFGLPVVLGDVSWRVTREPVYPRWWWWWGRPTDEPQVVASGDAALEDDGGFEYADEPTVEPGFEASRFYRFPGGCVTWEFDFDDDAPSAMSVELQPYRQFVTPDFEIPPGGLHYRWPDLPGPQIEERLEAKKAATLAFAAANPVDRRIFDVPDARFGIVTTGKGHLDLMEALRLLGIDREAARRPGSRRDAPILNRPGPMSTSSVPWTVPFERHSSVPSTPLASNSSWEPRLTKFLG